MTSIKLILSGRIEFVIKKEEDGEERFLAHLNLTEMSLLHMVNNMGFLRVFVLHYLNYRLNIAQD